MITLPVPLGSLVLAALATLPVPGGRPDDPGQEAQESADPERPASEVPS